MDVYESIEREITIFGVKRIAGGCSRQRPTYVNNCIVRTICDNMSIDEKPMSFADAVKFVEERVMKNYPSCRYFARMNRRKAGVLYYKTIIDSKTRREIFSIQILN